MIPAEVLWDEVGPHRRAIAAGELIGRFSASGAQAIAYRCKERPAGLSFAAVRGTQRDAARKAAPLHAALLERSRRGIRGQGGGTAARERVAAQCGAVP